MWELAPSSHLDIFNEVSWQMSGYCRMPWACQIMYLVICGWSKTCLLCLSCFLSFLWTTFKFRLQVCSLTLCLKWTAGMLLKQPWFHFCSDWLVYLWGWFKAKSRPCLNGVHAQFFRILMTTSLGCIVFSNAVTSQLMSWTGTWYSLSLTTFHYQYLAISWP